MPCDTCGSVLRLCWEHCFVPPGSADFPSAHATARGPRLRQPWPKHLFCRRGSVPGILPLSFLVDHKKQGKSFSPLLTQPHGAPLQASSGELCLHREKFVRNQNPRARATAPAHRSEVYPRGAGEEPQLTEQHYSLLFEHHPDCLFTLDRGGRLTTANPTCSRVLGCPIEALRGAHSDVLVAPEYCERHRAHLARALAGEPQAFEVSILHPHNGRTPWSITYVPIVTDGEVGGVYGIGRDITAQRKAEEEHRLTSEQLQHAQKMEAMGRLAGGVAHDFNNLLTVILGFARLLRSNQGGRDRQVLYVEQIENAAERAVQLTSQLLSFSRKQTTHLRVLDLNAQLAGTDPILRRLMSKGIELVCLMGSGVGAIQADPTQIEQVILNLALNARDAMPDGGRLIIQTMPIEVTEAQQRTPSVVPPGSYSVLAVSDDGCGMDAETLSKIFEPFFTTKEVGAGTGLGLFTVYGIVQQSGGYISVHSEPGAGTTFKIFFPQVESRVEPPAPTGNREPLPSGRETILLVDDEASLRLFAREVMKRAGYTVLEAENGEEALRLLRQEGARVDLVLTDMTMPLMSGRELVRHLSETHPEVRVLFTSGFAPREGLSADVLDHYEFIPKPFTPEELVRAVRNTLDQRHVQ